MEGDHNVKSAGHVKLDHRQNIDVRHVKHHCIHIHALRSIIQNMTTVNRHVPIIYTIIYENITLVIYTCIILK